LPDLDGYDGLAFDELRRISLARQEGALRADGVAKSLPLGPAGMDLALSMHSLIFSEEPDIAGRFRRTGEQVFFGGEGKHRRTGVDPDHIQPRLADLFTWFSRPRAESKDDFASRCARFLEEFLMIHPFVDGNGRVGRLILVAAARTWTAWEFDWRGAGQGDDGRGSRLSTSRRRRAYIHALEYAHRHSPMNKDEHRKHVVTDPCRPLARWLAAHLEDSGAALEEEPPTPSGTSGVSSA
jgi:fido (protein-threonine AMPylation protein)